MHLALKTVDAPLPIRRFPLRPIPSRFRALSKSLGIDRDKLPPYAQRHLLCRLQDLGRLEWSAVDSGAAEHHRIL
jgi:hypothetical protein